MHQISTVFRFSVLLMFIFSFVAISAQDDLEIITFDNDTRSSRSGNSTLPFGVIKTNPISFVFGQQFVEMEYLITDYFSVEGGVGLTFKPTLQEFQNSYLAFINEIITQDCVSSNFDPSFDYCDDFEFNNFEIRNVRLGARVSGAAKFYLYNDALDGQYIALNVLYKRENYEVLMIEETVDFQRSTTDYVNESINNFDYTVRYGYQNLYNPLVTDYFVGIGVRNTNQNRLDVGFDPTAGTWVNAKQTLKNSTLRFEIGVRLGLELATASASNKKKKKKKRRRR